MTSTGWKCASSYPEASFGEIDAEARMDGSALPSMVRREMMGVGLEIIVNGRDTGKKVVAPNCAECGQSMGIEGYRPWTIHGLEGDTVVNRAYYVCPSCKGQTLFPPGREASAPR